MEFVNHETHTVRLTPGAGSAFRDGALSLDPEELHTVVTEDDRIIGVRFDLARPGDRTRVANVLDVWDARKTEDGPTYPGLDGPAVPAGGDRRTHIVDGLQVVGCGRLPIGDGGLVVAHPKVLDYWGEGARWTPLAQEASLVADVYLDSELTDKRGAGEAFRDAMVRLSTTIGALAIEEQGRVVSFPATRTENRTDGPRISYVYQVQSQGPLLETYLYGQPMEGLYPTLIDPVEILDGALVSGNRGRMSTPTILHCRNPVIRRLLDDAGAGVAVLPIVLMEGHHQTVAQKRWSAAHAARLLDYIGADGAIFTQEGSGGMSMVDQMMTIEATADAGIKVVGVTYESGGSGGSDHPLLHYSPQATHLVSVGNREATVTLERPDTLLGMTQDEVGAEHPVAQYAVHHLHEEVDIPLFAISGGVSQVGAATSQGSPE